MLALQFGVGPATVVAVILRFANIVGDLMVVGAVEVIALATRAEPATEPARATVRIS